MKGIKYPMETYNDKLLKIKTTGRDDSNSDFYRFPYEPTPYSVLERLASSGYFKKGNKLVDYGCGKGRVDFFLAYYTKCKSIGIEYDERIYNTAMENMRTSVSSGRVTFELEDAQEWELPLDVDRCYFFNPFSVEILRKVFFRIKESYYMNPREILMFFYYPSDEYMAYLSSRDELEFIDEIDCQDLFEEKNRRERVVVFKIG